ICARRVRLATICRMRLLCVHRHSLSPSRHQGVIMSQDYAHALGARLRAIRAQQGLSLHGVEEKSEGRWKAVVVGSYERGDRAVTVAKLAELADFYGVPVAELLPEGRVPSGSEPATKIVIN